MSESKKEKAVEEHDTWWCETCADSIQMTRPEMIAHLKEKHGIDPSKIKGRKQMLMHADATDYFDYNWKVTIETPDQSPLVLTNHTRTERSEESKMYWT